MPRAWSVVLVAAACGRENFDDAGDGSGSAVMTGDFDGDTIDNMVDNCPQAYNPLQQDGEGDGVGDACDPHPTTAGDRRVALALFDGGVGDFVPDTITNWSLTAFPGFITSTPAADPTQVRLSTSTTVPNPTLQTSFVIREYGSLTSNEIRLQLAGINNFKCIARGQNSFVDEILTYMNESGGNNRTLGSVTAGSLTTMSVSYDGQNLSCTVASANLQPNYGGSIGSEITASIEIYGVQASIGYAAVYGVF